LYLLYVFFIFIVFLYCNFFFFFSSRRRHTRSKRDWSSDVCSSDPNLVHAAKKTVLVMFWLMLFLLFFVFCAVMFLSLFQLFMYTEFYLNMVGSVEFWKWALGIPIIVTILLFCTSVK